MSLKIIEDEIKRSLASSEPDVIAITGDWGVGKTYAWKQYLREAQEKPKGIALETYSYVSLFGINSLEELKNAIFQRAISTTKVDEKPSLQTLQTQTKSLMSSGFRGASWLSRHTQGGISPIVSAFGALGNLGNSIALLSVKSYIVCIDDIERRGEKLSIRDIFGLVSSLCEEKNCKVFLITNKNEEIREKEDFERYQEKVVNKLLAFAPTPEDSLRIAIKKETADTRYLSECCIKLGISNIRVIAKTLRFVGEIRPLIAHLHSEVIKQSIRSIVLLCWAVYEPNKAPSIDFIANRNKYIHANKGESVSGKHLAMNALLRDYQFSHMDQLDNALLDGIQNGYFHSALISPGALVSDAEYRKWDSFMDFKAAWDLYHGSFNDDGKEVTETLDSSARRNLQHLSLSDLNGVVTHFKEVGEFQLAHDLIRFYMDNKHNSNGAFNVSQMTPSSRPIDPDLKLAVAKRIQTFKDERHPTTVLLSVSGGWGAEDVAYLSSMSVNDFYSVFKTIKHDDLRKVIKNSLQFGNLSEPLNQISKTAVEALKLIGKESPTNAARVRRYGIEID